jgi:hypothetical protein
MPLSEEQAAELKLKLTPLVTKAFRANLNENDLDASFALLTVQEKRDIIKSIVDGDYNIASIASGVIAKNQADNANVIIDAIIQNDKIELIYLLSIL